MIKVKYIIAFILGILVTYSFIQLAPESIKYSFFNILDIEIEISHE